MKLILFSNIKGGVGKTTLCAHFANYLVGEKKKIGVIDADIQSSLTHHRDRDVQQNPDAEAAWDILPVKSIKNLSAAIDTFKNSDFDYILADCPGNLESEEMKILLKNADRIIVPLAYDDDTIAATTFYIRAVRQITGSTPFVFMPNRIKSTETSYDRQWTVIRRELEKLGTVTPKINDRISVKKYSTVEPMNPYQFKAVEHAFGEAYSALK